MAVAGSDIVLDVIRLADRSDRFLRDSQVQPAERCEPRQTEAGGAGAGEPAAAASLDARRAAGSCAHAMADGTPVGDRAQRQTRPPRTRSSCTPCRRSNIRWSSRFRCHALASIANHDDLRRIGLVMTGGIALIILLSALLLVQARCDRSDGGHGAGHPRRRVSAVLPAGRRPADRTADRRRSAGALAPAGRQFCRAERLCPASGVERAGAGVYPQADASRARGHGGRGGTAPEHEHRLQRGAAPFRRCADPARRRHHLRRLDRSGCRRSCWS